MITWTIKKISKNMFDDDHKFDHPNALYSCDLYSTNSKPITYKMHYADVMLLLQYFKVGQVLELTGKTFESVEKNVYSAMKLLLIHIRTGGEYTPPEHEEVHDIVAKALANFESPDLSNIDLETILEAFKKVWENLTPNNDWLTAFIDSVAAHSNGNVILIKDSSDMFSPSEEKPWIRLKLVRPVLEEKTVYLRPNRDPVFFDN